MIQSQQLLAIIENAISAIKYPQQPTALYEPIKYTMSTGGKRLRPTLLLAVMQALGKDPMIGINQALGIEMYHNFTLLHDDVMDGAELRRGHLTVHRRWNTNTAILSGDAMLSLAGQLMAKCDSSHLVPVINVFNQTAIEVYEGQQYDMDFEHRLDVTVDQYIDMIRLKTSVLIGCALKIGAILADASDDVCDAFYDYGINLGLGFQLQDDRLDTYGDPVIFGKQIGGDIINGKKTWLLISALNNDDSGELKNILSGSSLDEQEKIERVRAIYDRLGLNEKCAELINVYAQKAIAALRHIDMTGDASQYFISLADKLNTRLY